MILIVFVVSIWVGVRRVFVRKMEKNRQEGFFFRFPIFAVPYSSHRGVHKKDSNVRQKVGIFALYPLLVACKKMNINIFRNEEASIQSQFFNVT